MWPISETSDTAVLIGALIISLLPMVLPLVDIIIERGEVIGIGDVKIDFSIVPQTSAPGSQCPAISAFLASESRTALQPTSSTHSSKQPTAKSLLSILKTVTHGGKRGCFPSCRCGQAGKNRASRLCGTSNTGGEKRFHGWGAAGKLLRRLLLADPRVSPELSQGSRCRPAVGVGRASEWRNSTGCAPVDPAWSGDAAPMDGL